jgi:rhodanese-related sulfurtransferase/predicted transcriptional regulator
VEEELRGPEFKRIVFRELARIGKTLSDPTRLELLELLCQSEKSVDHVGRQLGLSTATVSHHLQALKASRLAQERRSGRFILYHASEMGQAAWKLLADIGGTYLAEVRAAVSQFFEKDWTYEPLDLEELRKKVDRGTILLLDVRPVEEFLAGHFPGAIPMPLPELREKVKTFPRDAEVVAYCRGPYCVLAHDAVRVLRARGIRAYHWRQGVPDWRRLATAATAEAPARRRTQSKGASK